MAEFYSEYYDRQVSLTRDESRSLIRIYLEVAREMGFGPELGEGDEDLLLYSGDVHYDHIAYHVETFGKKYVGYGEISYLFDV